MFTIPDKIVLADEEWLPVLQALRQSGETGGQFLPSVRRKAESVKLDRKRSFVENQIVVFNDGALELG